MSIRIRMLQTTNGAPDDGRRTYTYEDGLVYDVEDELAGVFLKFGYAEDASDYTPEKNEVLPVPGGMEIPETEEERRLREARANGISVSTDLSIVDDAHHPAQRTAILQAKEESASTHAIPFGVDDKLSRKELDEAARQIGLDTTKLKNKNEVRAAILAAR